MGASLEISPFFHHSATVIPVLGRGDGTFRPGQSYVVGGNPEFVAAGDLNRDGQTDLVISNGGNPAGMGMSVLMGNGDGSFQPVVDHPSSVSPGPLAISDFDGDGILDVAITHFSTYYTISVLPGLGDGSFGPPLNSSTGVTGGSIAVADFNEDGTPDLALPAGIAVDVFLNVGPLPVANLSAASLTFPTQLVGTASTQNVTLTNTGRGPLTIFSFTVTGEFSQQNTCGSSLDPGASCDIAVIFQPIIKGLKSATLTITDNARSSPQTITLNGSATAISVSPSSLDFGDVPVGNTSKTQHVNVTNVGAWPVAMQGISLHGVNAGDFGEINDCRSFLPPNSSCSITVRFTPFGLGARSASLDIADRGGASPQMVNLSGNGT
jgi:hypothetical protein